jgi:hypothetical protein
VGPAHISFGHEGLGEMQLIAIGASIDYRVEERAGAFTLEFSWSGFDNRGATSGRGYARIDGDTMHGKLFIRQGDESTFVARREHGARPGTASKGSPARRSVAARAQRAAHARDRAEIEGQAGKDAQDLGRALTRPRRYFFRRKSSSGAE